MGLPHPCLMMAVTSREGLAAAVDRAVGGGVDTVQWRDARTRIGKRDPILIGLVAATAGRATLIGSGAWESFVRLGLRAIHLPERAVPIGVVKYRIGKGALVGREVGSVSDAVQAEAAGADYVVVSIGRASDGGAEDTGMDTRLLQAVCGSVGISVLAAGALEPEDAADCVRAGAVGIVPDRIGQAPDPEISAAQYRVALEAAWADTGHRGLRSEP